MSIEDAPQEVTQPALFRTEVGVRVDPGDPKPAERYYIDDPYSNFTESQSSALPQQVDKSQTAGLSVEGLKLLQDAVESIGEANMRKAFSVLDDPRVVRSAEARGLTTNQARSRAAHGANDFEKHARKEYQNIQNTVTLGIGLVAAFGADVSTHRLVSFDDFRKKVSGPRNNNLRAGIYRARAWKPKFEDLLIEQHEPDQRPAAEMLPYHKLATRFRVRKDVDLAERTLLPESVRLFDSLLQPHGGVRFTAEEYNTFVRKPSAYKAAIRTAEAGTMITEDKYQQAIGSKVGAEQRVINSLQENIDTLQKAKLVIDGEDVGIQAVDTLYKTIQIFHGELETLARHEKLEEPKATALKQELEDTLLSAGQGRDLQVRAAWVTLIDVSMKYHQRKVSLFNKNIRQLSA